MKGILIFPGGTHLPLDRVDFFAICPENENVVVVSANRDQALKIETSSASAARFVIENLIDAFVKGEGRIDAIELIEQHSGGAYRSLDLPRRSLLTPAVVEKLKGGDQT